MELLAYDEMILLNQNDIKYWFRMLIYSARIADVG